MHFVCGDWRGNRGWPRVYNEWMKAGEQYWFKAKRYGWGWGLPSSWQGWVFFILWFVVLNVGTVRLMPQRPLAFVALLTLMTSILVAVCYAKGEPPSWRWGDKR